MTTLNSSTGSNVGSIVLNTVATTNTSSTTTTTTNVANSTNISSTAIANTVTLGESAYMFMRAKTITFSAQGLKPNTQYYPFFNGVDISGYCTATDGTVTSDLVTDSLGQLVGNFYLPANKFVAGSHKFVLVDNVRAVSGVSVPDPIYGQAEALYEANGVLKQQQTQVTINSVVNTNNVVTSVSNTTTEATTNFSTTVNVDLPPVTVIVPPPVVQCENWYFEYAVYSGDTYVFTVTSNSSTAPSTSVARPAAGSPFIYDASIAFVSTSAGGNNTWYHTYTARRVVAGSGSAVNTYRQEWVGATTDTRPDLSTFRPTGISASSSVVVTVPWTRVATVACPVSRGLGSATQLVGVTSQPYDPLAQSFFISSSTYPEGVFVTSIGVYFKTVDQSTPVVLELRNMVNGLPGSNVFPGARSLIPGSSAAQSPDSSVATVFRFDYPVYLAPNNEYCFVVKSSSMGYNLWCSKMGEIDVLTGKVIDAQPFTGTMFMSENNYTWIPDGYQDIKFDLNVAVFDTTKTANIIVKPQMNATGVQNYYGTAQNLPMSYLSTTIGTKVVGAKIPMHGLVTGDKIYIEGIAVPNPVTAYNNIRAADLNGTFTVTVVDEDQVTFTVGGSYNATKTGALNIQDEFYIIDNAPPVQSLGQSLVDAIPFVNTGTFSPSTIQTGVTTPTTPTPPTMSSVSSFRVYTNIFVNELMVDFMGTVLPETAITERVSIATGSSTSGAETPYGFKDYEVLPDIKDFYSYSEPRMIAIPLNETLHATELQNKPSAVVNLQMTSGNKDVSPVIDVNGMSLMVRSYKIDNQNDEIDLLTTESDLNDPTLNSEINSGTGNALAKYKSVVRSTSQFHNKVTLLVTANCAQPTDGSAAIDAYLRVSTDRETHNDRDWMWMPINGVYGTPFTNSPNKKATNEWMYILETSEPFNIYDIKLVMRSTNNSVVPKIYGLRTITDFI